MLDPSILAILADPFECIVRMDLEHREGQRVQFNDWTPEQIMLVNDWWDPVRQSLGARETTVVKVRNQGVGAITQAFIAWYADQCADPVKVAVIAHTEDTAVRHIARLQEFMRTLPKAIQPRSKRTNELKWEWENGTLFLGATAKGSKGKGQGFTFQMLHVTECGMFDNREEANKTIGSLGATMHRGSSHYFKVFESTSEGPGGWWESHVADAQRDPKHNFRFFPWTINPSFFEPFDSMEERETFIANLTDADRDTVAKHDHYIADLAREHPRDYQMVCDLFPQLVEVTPEQLLWRRRKVSEHGGEEYLFRHNYPMTVQEAFETGGIGYFSNSLLSTARLKCRAGTRTTWGAMLWEEYQREDAYVVSCDPAEGGGGDYHVITVLNHRLEQCLVWSDNISSPENVGELAVRVAAAYGNALLLIEANRGTQALKAARRIGYRHLYMERDGKDLTTWGNQTSVSTGTSGKHGLFGHARTQLNAGRVLIRDVLTLDELLNIREDSSGRLGGANKKHDDRAMAWVLAVWAARRIEGHVTNRIANISARFGLQDDELRRTTPFG